MDNQPRIPRTLDDLKGLLPSGHHIWTDAHSHDGVSLVPVLEEILRQLNFVRDPKHANLEPLGWYCFTQGEAGQRDVASYLQMAPGPNATQLAKTVYERGLRTEVELFYSRDDRFERRAGFDDLYHLITQLLDRGHRVAMPPLDQFHSHLLQYRREGALYVLDRIEEMPDLGRAGRARYGRELAALESSGIPLITLSSTMPQQL